MCGFRSFPSKDPAHVAFRDAELTGNGARGLLRSGRSSGNNLALGQPRHRARTALQIPTKPAGDSDLKPATIPT
jgi:hypothetical protein